MSRAQQVTTLRQQVAAARAARGNRAALAALYVETIGYDPFEDDPTISIEDVWGVLIDYPMEIAYSLGIHREEIYSD